MIIWGSKGKEKTVSSGQFFCPRCMTLRPYKYKKVGRYFTLYFIPLFETKNLGEYIECQICQTPFKPEVLNYSQSLEREVEQQEQMKKMIKDMSDGLDAGASIQTLVSAIKSAGGNDEVAAAAIYAATQGKIKACKNCGSAFKATLIYCPICGNPLIEQNF